ncbi:MAG TPA: sialidase family protein [Planctomycetota bacterium]|nr:sialidase family protein [Planctomycetota bacterium]
MRFALRWIVLIVTATGFGASARERRWVLIDGETNPLGAPLPETTAVPCTPDGKPRLGDALGCPDPCLLPDGTILLLNKRYHCDYAGRRSQPRLYQVPSTMEVSRSTDGGRTWDYIGPLDSDPRFHDMLGFAFHPKGAPAGFARAFVERLAKGLGHKLQTTWTYTTEDGGKTWSQGELLFGPEPEKGGGLSHAFNGVQVLADGIVLLPLQRLGPWRRVLGEKGGLVFHPPVVLRCKPTDDPRAMGARREHWEALEVGHDLPTCDTATPAAILSEPDAVARPDGSLLLIIRSSCGWMFQSGSPDGGKTWTRLHRSTFGCTNSKHSLLPLRDGTLLMAHHDANNTESVLKRTPLSVSLSRDGGRTWERTVSVGWKSFWHYGYPQGIELPDGELLFFSRYGPLHDAEAVGVTRVSRQFLESARISLNAEGCRIEGGVLHLEHPEAATSAANRLPLGYPATTCVEATVGELKGRFQLLSLVGEGSMELVALGVRREGDTVALDVFDLDGERCQVGWRGLGVAEQLGQPLTARLTLLDPYRYRLEVAGRVFEGLTAKPLEAYTARIGANVMRRNDPLCKAAIRATIRRWELSSGTTPYQPSPIWEQAHPLYRFHTMHFALDEHGPFHGQVPRIGVNLSIPQGGWGGMDERNPYVVDVNPGSRHDGMLAVDKPFVGPAGTVAFYGLVFGGRRQPLTLLEAGPLRLGFAAGEKLVATAKLGESQIEGRPVPEGTAGLFAWRWATQAGRLRMELMHLQADGKLTGVGGGVLPALPEVKGPVRWFLDSGGTAPFRGRLAVLGAWQRALADDELKGLGRY